MDGVPELRGVFDDALRQIDVVRLVAEAGPPGEMPTAVLAVGKAAGAMLAGARVWLREETPVVLVAPWVRGLGGRGVRRLRGTHPVPGAGSRRAARFARHWLGSMGEGDRVLVLLSGGASALLAEPAHGLPLGQKVRLVERLAAAGADIATLNLVRRHLSRVKGGRLARAAAPAHVDVWLASDVVEPAGLPVEVQVGSGPFAADPTTVDDARAALATAGITTTVRFDESVKHVANARHRVLVDNGAARRAVAEVAAARGLAARIVERAVTGDAEEAARRLVEVGAGLAPGTLLVAGGETTVRLPRPCPPPGGRAQHFALAAALALEAAGARGTVLAAGTDGRDGTTEAMGACVDETTAAAVRAAGLDPEVCLRERRAHEALRAAGGLLAARATGQNVADLYLLLIR